MAAGDKVDKTEKVELQVGGIVDLGPVTRVIREDVPNPRFDVKVTLTTRGWTWEIEVKDCPDGTLAMHLADQAREVVAAQMKDILAEQSEKSDKVDY